MYRIFLLIFTVLFLSACGDNEVNSYSLDFEYNYEDLTEAGEIDYYDGFMTADVDSESDTGGIHFKQQSYEYEYYYEGDASYESVISSGDESWRESIFSTDEIKEYYFTEYNIVLEVQEILNNTEPDEEEETDSMQKSYYQLNSADTLEVVDAIGINFPEDEEVTDGELMLGIDPDTDFIIEMYFKYNSTLQNEDLTNELTFKYNHINEDDIVERPDEVDDIE